MYKNTKILFVVLAIFIILGAAYAFAAANTIPDSTAGSGSSTVNGYTVSSIAYDLNATDPTIVDHITFTITPDAGNDKALTVLVQTAAGGSWTSCTLTDGVLPAVNVDCDYTAGSLSLASVTALNVVANGTTDPNP